jgi:hypothetical protein
MVLKMTEQRSLYSLGTTLIALHRQGYTAARGYSFAERDGDFGEGSITVQAVCLPPPEKAKKDDKPNLFCRLFNSIGKK